MFQSLVSKNDYEMKRVFHPWYLNYHEPIGKFQESLISLICNFRVTDLVTYCRRNRRSGRYAGWGEAEKKYSDLFHLDIDERIFPAMCHRSHLDPQRLIKESYKWVKCLGDGYEWKNGCGCYYVFINSDGVIQLVSEGIQVF